MPHSQAKLAPGLSPNQAARGGSLWVLFQGESECRYAGLRLMTDGIEPGAGRGIAAYGNLQVESERAVYGVVSEAV